MVIVRLLLPPPEFTVIFVAADVVIDPAARNVRLGVLIVRVAPLEMVSVMPLEMLTDAPVA